MANVNFSVSVGTPIPMTFRRYPLPVAVIEVVPECRGYEYILASDDLVIINSCNPKIVAMLPA